MQGLLRWSLLIVGLIALLFMQSARADVALRVQAQPVEDPIQAFVTVTDASGNPVSGLTAADFTVLVDGVAVDRPRLLAAAIPGPEPACLRRLRDGLQPFGRREPSSR